MPVPRSSASATSEESVCLPASVDIKSVCPELPALPASSTPARSCVDNNTAISAETSGDWTNCAEAYSDVRFIEYVEAGASEEACSTSINGGPIFADICPVTCGTCPPAPTSTSAPAPVSTSTPAPTPAAASSPAPNTESGFNFEAFLVLLVIVCACGCLCKEMKKKKDAANEGAKDGRESDIDISDGGSSADVRTLLATASPFLFVDV
eukprot:SAG31_NODE_4830_length_2920_cov_1.951436_3_plen_209_part_00